MISNNKLNVALVGTGYWGPNVARSLVSTGKSTLVWLCDLNKKNLSKVAELHPGTKTTNNLSDLLGDHTLDAIAISTPTKTHFNIAKQALEAGKHVLVEKPLADNLADSQELTRIAAKKGLVLMVGHVFQYNAALMKLKEIINSGELGDIYYLSFVRTNLGPVRTDVNALWDLASHDVSIMCDLLGRSPDAVSATGSAFLNTGVEDVVFATFKFTDGPQANIHASWLNPKKVRQLTVIGSKKMAIWDDLDLRAPLTVIDKRVDVPSPGAVGDTYTDFKTICVDGGVTIPKVPITQPLQEECLHFLESIKNKTKPLTDGFNGALIVNILESANKSLRANGEYIACDSKVK